MTANQRGFLLLCLFSASCGRPPQEASYALSNAISAQEVTEDGKVLAIPAEGITEVDVNSAIVLTMNEAAIRAAVPGSTRVDPAKVQALEVRMRQLDALLEEQRKLIENLYAMASDDSITERELADHGKRERQLTEQIIEVATERGDDPDSLYSGKGYGKVLDYLARLLNEARRDHDELLQQLDTAQWRVAASLHSNARAEPVHAPNYDSLEAGPVDVRNKLIPVVDERVKSELKQDEKLAKTARNLDEFTQLLAKEAKRKATALGTELAQYARELPQRITNLEALNTTNRMVKRLMDPFGKTLDAAKSAVTPCKTASEAVKASPSTSDVEVLVLKTYSAASDCVKALQSLSQNAEQTLKAVTELAKEPAPDQVLPELESELSAMAEQARSIADLHAFLNKAEAPLLAPAWAPDEAFTDRPLGDLADTHLNLITTSRQMGDTLSYRGSVRDTRDGTVVVEGPLRSTKVVQNGAQVRVSGTLLFVQPFALADNEGDFRAAPALTAAFHYRFGRSSGEQAPTGACAAWNVISPGIGLHAATIVMGEVEDDATTGDELADSPETPHVTPGLVVQLFGDLLQGGVGYDFISARAYWFVGVGLETATDLGITFDL